MSRKSQRIPVVLFALTTMAAAGCSGMSEQPSDTSVGNPAVLAGTFLVSLVAPDTNLGTAGYTSLVGKVADGPTPVAVTFTDASTSGACKLKKPRVPFCETACTGGSICVDDNKCQGYPTTKSVGTVHASGIKTASGEAEFNMDAVGGSYQPGGAALPYPAFAEGAQLAVSSSGGAYSAFTLRAAGIAPLNLINQQIPVAMNQAVSLSWTPPAQSGTSKIHVKLDISHHGGTKGMIECDSEDSGSLDIAASLITELVSLGTAGYPTIVVTRSATPGTAVIAPGRVELNVVSAVERAVQVPGVVSCSDSSQCTGGKTCQADLTCK